MSLVTPPNSNGWTIPLNNALDLVVSKQHGFNPRSKLCTLYLRLLQKYLLANEIININKIRARGEPYLLN
jgi:hypothetical protein